MNVNQVREKFVKAAASYVGVKEGTSAHHAIIDLYNTIKPLPAGYKLKYSDAWCAGFVSAMVQKVGYTDIIPCECSCSRMIKLMQQKGIFVENENRVPNPGDIIFYDWEDNGAGDNKGVSDHVGIVESVSGNKFTVIEGNYSNSVKRRTLTVNGKYIRGYGVPNYAAKATEDVVEDTKPVVNKKSIDEIAKEVALGKWGNGVVRRTKLEAAGYNYAEVQKAVNALVSKNNNANSVDKIAKEVILGKWKTGAERKKMLEAAGYDYATVQKRVNEILKKKV